MNAASCCHTIEECPGLYVDAFRGVLLRQTSNATNSFILTHYHGDHYGSLPRDFKYQGPAMIHCTPTTAALLIRVHCVPLEFVCAHEYGETWVHSSHANITFYDANHCPGAAIVLIQLIKNEIYHLHCGDMRYHEKMKLYPLLNQAVQNRKIDLVYLDTTYGHPKHDFIPQEEAIQSIASTIQEKLSNNDTTLILLSCYSIGKEKVLWECASRTNQLVYVTEKKYKMLECILQEGEESNQILDKCTIDPGQSDIHVIPMGVAGEIWPYFQPNYRNCAEYVDGLSKHYDRIVAFLPTGWANASNWNKKNSISCQQVDYKTKGGSVEVEIRLVSYSEHSAFSELESFVDFLRPRKVIPTVFGDEKDRRKIENHFRNKVDSTRAKRKFFQEMEQSSAEKVSRTTQSIGELPTHLSRLDPSRKTRQIVDNIHSENVTTLVAMGFDAVTAKCALNLVSNNLEAALNELLNPASSMSKKKPSYQQESGFIDLVDSPKKPPSSIASFFTKKEKSQH